MRACFSLMREAKQYLEDMLGTDKLVYNIGVNNGESAGRTIPHLHIHLIPRHWGDTEDHVGGVRKVVAEKGNYTLNRERWGVYWGPQLNFLEVIDSVVSGE